MSPSGPRPEAALFVPYPPIEAHGAIGNRRTAALVAADGSADWLCLPDYGGTVTFGALLDSERGGFFRFGPKDLLLGSQRYVEHSPVLQTTWSTPEYELELTDFMPAPADDADPDPRGLVRRLRCLRGGALCRLDLRACYEFDQSAAGERHGRRLVFDMDAFPTTLWASFRLRLEGPWAWGEIDLREGEECFAVFEFERRAEAWSAERVEDELAAVLAYWRRWSARLTYDGPRAEQVHRSATVIHLMGYAPNGSSVAAPTSSLPERIAGDRNYDYRFAWVRDASLSVGMLSQLGDTETAAHYMDWLAKLDSCTDAPLQVSYGIDGEHDLTEHDRYDLHGYRGSQPVRFGNHVYLQRQLGSLGYLTDCAYMFMSHCDKWRPEYWRLVERAAEYTAATWRGQDHGIWELDAETHHVSSKVMCWVTLDRALRIAQELDHGTGVKDWRRVMDDIRREVLERGWSQRLKAFRQSYGSDTVDASTLLIPLMGFLTPADRRVLQTIDRVEQLLTLNGLVHRFHAPFTEGLEDLPLGQFEGAFLPSTFMLASAYARAGRLAKAEAILDRVEALTGPSGLFPEEIDARSGAFLGNMPLLFSHAEYVRAVLELAQGLHAAGHETRQARRRAKRRPNHARSADAQPRPGARGHSRGPRHAAATGAKRSGD